MGSQHDAFFARLEGSLEREGFKTNRPTPSGMNVFSARRGAVNVTVNFAPRDNRVSVKLTVSRGSPGAPTPVFDAISHRFGNEGANLLGNVDWDDAPTKTESKVQVSTTMSAADRRAHYQWVLHNASVLRDWARWSESLKT